MSEVKSSEICLTKKWLCGCQEDVRSLSLSGQELKFSNQIDVKLDILADDAKLNRLDDAS
jgi:hypothetical protein